MAGLLKPRSLWGKNVKILKQNVALTTEKVATTSIASRLLANLAKTSLIPKNKLC